MMLPLRLLHLLRKTLDSLLLHPSLPSENTRRRLEAAAPLVTLAILEISDTAV
jgi:hypothetical protein